jgi:hypothetical protein
MAPSLYPVLIIHVLLSNIVFFGLWVDRSVKKTHAAARYRGQ